jgi:branched-chain amino acid transport system permease protein
MPPLRDDPIVIEDDVTFASREAAEWELFCRRWREQTGEIINELYEDRTA